MTDARKKEAETSMVALDAALAPFLLARIQAGDKAALAEFFVSVEARLRRRYRKRTLVDLRRLFDSRDLAATTYVRLDDFLSRVGFFKATTIDELWHLARRTADNIVFEWERRLKAEQQAIIRHERDNGTAFDQAGHGEANARRLAEVLNSIDSAEDRELILLRAKGLRWQPIARILGVSAETLRQRFRRIKKDVLEIIPPRAP